MADVRVGNCASYQSVPANVVLNTIDPGSNIAFLPALANSNATLRAYMPVSMAKNTQITPIQNPAYCKPGINQIGKMKKNEIDPKAPVTKILVSNFEGPLTVKCTINSPQTLQTPAPMAFIPQSSSQLAFSQPYYYGENYQSPCTSNLCFNGYERPIRSRSRKRNSNGHSSSPRRSKNKQKERSTTAKKKNSQTTKTSAPPAPPPPPPPPPPPMTPTLAPPALVPTVKELQSVPLRPPPQKSQSLCFSLAQTPPLNESKIEPLRLEHSNEAKNNHGGISTGPCPSICPQKFIIKAHVTKEKERPHSAAAPRRNTIEIQKSTPKQPSPPIERRPKRPVSSALPLIRAADVAPLRTTIQPSPPPQQPLETQGLFGLRKVFKTKNDSSRFSRMHQDPEVPTWVRRPNNEDDEEEDTSLPRHVRPTSHVNPQTFDDFANGHFKSTPKLAPKPILQWQTRNLIDDDTQASPMIEYEKYHGNASSRGSPIEETYEVMLDYFPMGDEINNAGRSDTRQHNPFFRATQHPETRGLYYNVDGKSVSREGQRLIRNCD